MHRIVGLDVASHAVRFVALESSFRGFEVLEARSVALEPPPPDGSEPPPMAQRIKAALRTLSFSPGDDSVAVSLPGATVASHLFTLPFVDPRRIEQVLPAEVEGAIPFEMDEVVWDHAVLSQANGKSEVLVGVVRKEALREWIALLAAAGIEPRMVTFAPLALGALAERGLLADLEGGGQGGPEATSAEANAARSCLLLDAEPDRADLVVLRDGKAELCRALSASSAAVWEAATDESAQDKLLNPIVRDLKITLRARGKAARPQPSPGRILLAGTLASLPGAAERLSAELGIPTTQLTLAPGSVALPEGSAPAHEIALALGLALRAQQPRGRLNFRKGEFAFTRDFSTARRQIAQIAIAAAVLLALALVLGVARVTSLSAQLKDYDDAVCAATKKILGTCTTDYRQAVSQLSGGKSKAAGIPRIGAADVLSEVMAHLPADAMPLIEDAEVTTKSVRLKGVVGNFGAVSPIVTSLQTDKCFGAIAPPLTEKVRDGADKDKIHFSMDFAYTCSGEAPGGA